MPLPDAARVVDQLPAPLRPTVAPLVKTAMGLAVGTVCGVLLLVLALFHAAVGPERAKDLWVWLLGNNLFHGYTPTPLGATVGFAWGVGAGFVLGFVLAAGRNAIIALWILWVGARERLRADRGVLDDLM